jgi:hypothetical protein
MQKAIDRPQRETFEWIIVQSFVDIGRLPIISHSDPLSKIVAWLLGIEVCLARTSGACSADCSSPLPFLSLKLTVPARRSARS